MDKIKWCLNAKNGIELVEPSGNLSEAYFKKAEEALESMALVKSQSWQISTAYYSMYFSLYAILMKIGVKCEIHSCTIEFMRRFLLDYFSSEDCKLVEDSFNARVDSQYYVSAEVSDEARKNMMRKAPYFLAKCKTMALRIDEERVKNVRGTMKKYT